MVEKLNFLPLINKIFEVMMEAVKYCSLDKLPMLFLKWAGNIEGICDKSQLLFLILILK
jgi:hypothetical protein